MSKPHSDDPPPEQDLDWGPARSGGDSYVTHTLVQVSARRIELHPSTVAKLVFSYVALFALAGVVGAIIVAVVSEWVLAGGLMLFGVGMMWVSVRLFGVFDRFCVFDLDRGLYWTGRLAEPGPEAVPLAEVRAIQLLNEWVDAGEAYYPAFELNLVLDDGRRRNVIDHANPEVILATAEALAALLEVPVWIAPSMDAMLKTIRGA